MILSEFLKHSYTNLKQIYEIIKNKLPIYKEAVYSDPENLILRYSPENRSKFAKLNKYLSDTYNVFIGFGSYTDFIVTSIEEASHKTHFHSVNQALVKYLKEHPELNIQNGVGFDWYSFYNVNAADKKFDDKNAYYHIAQTPPSVILKVGLKASEAVYRNSHYSYNPAVFLFSIARANHYITSHDYKDETAEEVVGFDMSKYHSNSDTISYVYKVTLPKDVKSNTDVVDPVWKSAVFVEQNIKPENIVCIGYHMPNNFDGKENGYFTGDKTRVDSFADIVRSDTAMKNVKLKTKDEFAIESYTSIVKNKLKSLYKPLNELIKDFYYTSFSDYRLNTALKEEYNTDLDKFINIMLQESLTTKQIVDKIKHIIIDVVEKGYTIQSSINQYKHLKDDLNNTKEYMKYLKSKKVYEDDYYNELTHETLMYRQEECNAEIKRLNKEIRTMKKNVFDKWNNAKEQIKAL